MQQQQKTEVSMRARAATLRARIASFPTQKLRETLAKAELVETDPVFRRAIVADFIVKTKSISGRTLTEDEATTRVRAASAANACYIREELASREGAAT